MTKISGALPKHFVEPQRVLSAILVGLVALSCGTGCGHGPREKPNILFLLIDSLRSDHLGFAGYGRPTSACIDSLADAGVAFTSCTAQAPMTLYSVPSLLTGRYPSSVMHRSSRQSRQEVESWHAVTLGAGVAAIPLLLRPYGYSSAAFVTNSVASRNVLRLPQQFDHFDDAVRCQSEDCAARVNRLAVRWLSSVKGEPWFCLIHYMDVHFPYRAPAEYAAAFSEAYGRFPLVTGTYLSELGKKGGPVPAEVRYVVDMYDAEIAYLDEQICGILHTLKTMGLADNLLVVVVSDHGDEFMEHGGWGHGQSLHEELTRCPLVFSWSGHIPRGRVVDGRIQNIDVVPTVLDLLHIPIPDGVQGSSLLSSFRGKAPSDLAFSEMEGVAVQRGRWKLWERPSGRKSLYDLSSDPGEREDLARSMPETLLSLEAQMGTWVADLANPPAPAVPHEEVILDSVAVEQLRSLGYLE